MKILFMADVVPNLNSGASGTEIQTIKALRDLGHEVDEIWADGLSHCIKHGNLHYLLELPVSYAIAVKRMLKLKHYDVVHINQPHGYLAARLIRKSYPNTIFVHRSHGLELRVSRDLKKWKEKYNEINKKGLSLLASKTLASMLKYNSYQIARHADGHIVSASQCKDFLVTEMGIDINKIAVIPQAAPDYLLDGNAHKIDGSRIKRILYVGQFAFFKAPIVLARVINELARLRDDVMFTWVCSAEHHEQARALLEPLCQPRVEFLDWMSQEELLEVYDQHGIFLFPSFFEGFGKAFMEAMARGLCVVAADNGGVRDVIQQGISGYKVPTGDVQAMSEACMRLIDNPDEAISVSEGAIETAHSYSWDRVAKETAGFYQSLLDNRKYAS